MEILDEHLNKTTCLMNKQPLSERGDPQHETNSTSQIQFHSEEL